MQLPSRLPFPSLATLYVVIVMLVAASAQNQPPQHPGSSPLGDPSPVDPGLINEQDIGPMASELKLPSRMLPRLKAAIQREYSQKQSALVRLSHD